jgi:hypothetical protein
MHFSTVDSSYSVAPLSRFLAYFRISQLRVFIAGHSLYLAAGPMASS